MCTDWTKPLVIRCGLLCADLAQNRYLDDPAFVEYLYYLQYWRELPYVRYIAFPHCLRMLELLQSKSFRTAMKRADFKDYVLHQQTCHWKYRNIERNADTSAGAGDL